MLSYTLEEEKLNLKLIMSYVKSIDTNINNKTHAVLS